LRLVTILLHILMKYLNLTTNSPDTVFAKTDTKNQHWFLIRYVLCAGMIEKMIQMMQFLMPFCETSFWFVWSACRLNVAKFQLWIQPYTTLRSAACWVSDGESWVMLIDSHLSEKQFVSGQNMAEIIQTTSSGLSGNRNAVLVLGSLSQFDSLLICCRLQMFPRSCIMKQQTETVGHQICIS